MKVKQRLQIGSDNFWHDLTDGGYLNPMDICKNKKDAEKVIAAIEVVKEFKNSCEEQIEGFIQ